MKFLHTSDLHYGAAPDANRPWGKERAAVLKDAFDRIIRACRRENVDMLIIAGDLFDCLPTEEDIRKVNESFATIPDTRVIILPGKSDALFVSSPVLTYPWQDNVTYVSNRNASGEAVSFPTFMMRQAASSPLSAGRKMWNCRTVSAMSPSAAVIAPRSSAKIIWFIPEVPSPLHLPTAERTAIISVKSMTAAS